MEGPVLGLCESILQYFFLRKSCKRRHLRIKRNCKDKVRFMSGTGEANMLLTSEDRRIQGADEDS